MPSDALRAVMLTQPLERLQFDAGELIRQYPPRWHHRNKTAVFESACSFDYRFNPITKKELPELNYEVSILSEPKIVNDAKSLDPKKDGVIVKCADGRCGLLLPDIDDQYYRTANNDRLPKGGNIANTRSFFFL